MSDLNAGLVANPPVNRLLRHPLSDCSLVWSNEPRIKSIGRSLRPAFTSAFSAKSAVYFIMLASFVLRHSTVFPLRLPLWQSDRPAGSGRLRRCVGAFAEIGLWGASPAAAVSLAYTTVYNTLHLGYCSTRRTKGLGRISRSAAPAGCHFWQCQQQYTEGSTYRANRRESARSSQLGVKVTETGWPRPRLVRRAISAGIGPGTALGG
jgi:hypothetical protein